jgi:phospholipid/cholesterol/gamma-HCH transport system substrate-binding protein
VLLGAVVLGGLALTGIGIFAVGSRQWLWSDTFHVRAGFAQIRGVEVGTRVRVQGIDAGEVAAVEPPAEPGGAVMLRLRLDGRLRDLIRADASVEIVSEGMVGGKVVEIHPGTPGAGPVADQAVLASRPTPELSDLLSQVGNTLEEIRAGEGSLGKLVKDDEAYRELVKLLRQGGGTLASLKQGSDALKGLPLVRDYVQDPYKELVRPECTRNLRWFKEADLFEPGQAVLTAQGRQELDKLAPWLTGLKHKGSEVVVAAYADPDRLPDADLARAVTYKQSKAVCDYLTSQHGVHRMGWFSWSRKVTPLGCGLNPPPLPEKEPLPPARIEVLVFVPQV